MHMILHTKEGATENPYICCPQDLVRQQVLVQTSARMHRTMLYFLSV